MAVAFCGGGGFVLHPPPAQVLFFFLWLGFFLFTEQHHRGSRRRRRAKERFSIASDRDSFVSFRVHATMCRGRGTLLLEGMERTAVCKFFLNLNASTVFSFFCENASGRHPKNPTILPKKIENFRERQAPRSLEAPRAPPFPFNFLFFFINSLFFESFFFFHAVLCVRVFIRCGPLGLDDVSRTS